MIRGPAATASLGLALCLVAGLFDTPALYVPGAALALIAVASLAVTALIARTTTVTRTPARASVEEGDPLRLSVSVAGPLIALGAAQLCAWPGAEPAALPRRRRQRVELEARLGRRGRHTLGATRLRVGDPFGVVARLVESAPTEVLVLPRVEALGPTALRRIAGAQHGPRSRAGAPRGVAVDADTLQPHRPGAPASRIHWPTVARTGRLHERRLGTDADRRPLVVLDTARPASDAALDACVRAATSLCRALAARGGCTVLLPGQQHAAALAPGLRGWPALHAQLALAPAGVPPAAVGLGRASTVLWVSAAEGGPDTGALGAGADVLVVSPFPRAGRPVAFTVSGCAAQPAGPAKRAAANAAATGTRAA